MSKMITNGIHNLIKRYDARLHHFYYITYIAQTRLTHNTLCQKLGKGYLMISGNIILLV